jgi:mediator of RNA polymerase II transcription subunit 13
VLCRRGPPSSCYGSLTGLEVRDGIEACLGSLDYARQVAALVDGNGGGPFHRLDNHVQPLHPWLIQPNVAHLVANSTEVVQLLKSLQPLLQDAIQKKRSTRLWESVYTISGPLTWRDFHLMAGRDERTEAGARRLRRRRLADRVAAGTRCCWSRSASATMSCTSSWRPKTTTCSTRRRNSSGKYEQCRLGTHRPLSDKLRDGVMRIGQTNAKRAGGSDDLDSWFRDIGNSPTASQLRMYAHISAKLLGM